MGFVIIAPLGSNLDALFVSIKEFPVDKVILVVLDTAETEIAKAKKELERFKIPVTVEEVQGSFMEGFFGLLPRLIRDEPGARFLINIATADSLSAASALSAAFAYGVKALTVNKDAVVELPVLSFSYYRFLGNRKFEILKFLDSKGKLTLEQIGASTRMSMPLVSYHLNGNKKAQGLKELGLVEVASEKGKSEIQLTGFGKLIARGSYN